MNPDRTLFVTWSAAERREFLPVARLSRRREYEETVYEFAYIRGAYDAMAHGFRPFLAFPTLEHVYRSRELFPFFSNRVMRATRPDFRSYVHTLGLSRSAADPLEILGRSGGRRGETDRVEVVPAPTPDQSAAWSLIFLLRRIRDCEGAEERIMNLVPGERLLLRVLDARNSTQPEAITVRTAENHRLGYMPDYLVGDLAEIIDRRVPIDVCVEQVNLPPTPLYRRLLCRLEVQWPRGFTPFQGEQFQPLEPQAVAGSAALT